MPPIGEPRAAPEPQRPLRCEGVRFAALRGCLAPAPPRAFLGVAASAGSALTCAADGPGVHSWEGRSAASANGLRGGAAAATRLRLAPDAFLGLGGRELPPSAAAGCAPLCSATLSRGVDTAPAKVKFTVSVECSSHGEKQW